MQQKEQFSEPVMHLRKTSLLKKIFKKTLLIIKWNCCCLDYKVLLKMDLFLHQQQIFLLVVVSSFESFKKNLLWNYSHQFFFCPFSQIVGGGFQGFVLSPTLLLKTRVMTDPVFRNQMSMIEVSNFFFFWIREFFKIFLFQRLLNCRLKLEWKWFVMKD